MSITFGIGHNTIRSYKRLAYTPWHAIAEFVDNSSQAYFNNKDTLDQQFAEDGEKLTVSISYDSDKGLLTIYDTSIGMNLEELERALQVGISPADTSGRSKYGMGMKTAACWMGNFWTVETKKLGETRAYKVPVGVEEIADGDSELLHEEFLKPAHLHYTLISIADHNRKFHGRTLGKIKEYLASMYREDFRSGVMELQWQGQTLSWDEIDNRLMHDRLGKLYKMPFDFEVNGKRVSGLAGVLGQGGRAYAGFSIIHSGRVVKGYPDSWRPERIYGAGGGRNDLINQRLVGEIHLDDFDVSHTKDDILWFGEEEELVERELQAKIKDYIEAARSTRTTQEGPKGPSEAEIDAALAELKEELLSKEMIDQIQILTVPSPEDIRSSHHAIAQEVIQSEPDFTAQVGDQLRVSVFVEPSMSANDPYVIYETASEDSVCIIINQNHPHFRQIEGAEGVANYFRHCIYDAIAEWQTAKRIGTIDPDTVKTIKDGLLRVALHILETAD
jgi:hypothetical protein